MYFTHNQSITQTFATDVSDLRRKKNNMGQFESFWGGVNSDTYTKGNWQEPLANSLNDKR